MLYTKGTDYSELNRTEGYEVLYFINHIAAKWTWTRGNPPVTISPDLSIYQKIEKMIRLHVPKNILTHKKIADWIMENWSKV